jgi:hypothetical protein
MTIHETIAETTTERTQSVPRERVLEMLRSADREALSNTIIHFNNGGGVRVSFHRHTAVQVRELLRLLGVGLEPVGSDYLYDCDRLVTHFGDGTDYLFGGVAVDWHTDPDA